MAMLSRTARLPASRMNTLDGYDEPSGLKPAVATILPSGDTARRSSARRCGVEVWSLLAQGRSGDEVVGELQTRYPAAGDDVTEPVHALIDELLQEELLDPAAENGNGHSAGAAVLAAAPPGSFVPPVLKKFTDLQYFLLVDPIHQVEAAGWPHERRDAAEADGAA